MSCPPTTPGDAILTDHGNAQIPTAGSCGDWYSSCQNPLYAIDHQDTCGQLEIVQLDIMPPFVEVAKGRASAVRLVATFSDGRVADVTGQGVFTSEAPAVATADGGGLVRGVDVGTAALTGTWRGLLATATISVFDNVCVASQPWDVVVVADNGSEWVSGIVSVARGVNVIRGRALRQLRSSAANQYPQAILALQLSMDLRDNQAFNALSGWEQSGNPTRPSIGTRTGTDRIAFAGVAGWYDSIMPFPGGSDDPGKAIMQAYAMHQTGRTSVRKAIVVFSTGGESRCSPSVLSACTAAKNAGIHVAVVTPLNESDLVYSWCHQPRTAWDVLQSSASPCMFFDSVTGNVHATAGTILRIACEGCGSSGSGIGIGNI